MCFSIKNEKDFYKKTAQIKCNNILLSCSIEEVEKVKVKLAKEIKELQIKMHADEKV